MMRIFLTLLLSLALFGCASEEENSIEASESSLMQIRRAVVSVIGEPRSISENQREYFSKYYPKGQDLKFDPEKSKQRLYTHVTILGARRPYTIETKVLIEAWSTEGFEPVGEDTDLALKATKEIRDKLNQRRDGQNIIDDFRAF
jgi:hypothetical protein